MGITIGIAAALSLAGGIFYNKLRVKFNGIIGVGGSYMALCGIIALCSIIGMTFFGEGISAAELVVCIIFSVIGIGYLIYAMIFNCTTVAQKVFLPLVATLISIGFCWRIVLAIIFKMPMSDGTETRARFPGMLIDDKGETWELQYDSGDNAGYRCRKTGADIVLRYTGELDLPYGWRAV